MEVEFQLFNCYVEGPVSGDPHPMTITTKRAREILYAAHEAWNRRDTAALLALYDDDLTYWNNFGGPGGGPLTITGKDELRSFLAGLAGFEALSVPERFQLKDGVGYATAAFFMKHPKTSITHSSVFRQVVTYRNERILRLEEYHDGAAFSAFLAMLEE
jgi:ketosteroid isomerase-like protein